MLLKPEIKRERVCVVNVRVCARESAPEGERQRYAERDSGSETEGVRQRE